MQVPGFYQGIGGRGGGGRGLSHTLPTILQSQLHAQVTPLREEETWRSPPPPLTYTCKVCGYVYDHVSLDVSIVALALSV